MITDKGKAYIARNFGVNNCYAMEEIVPCTVYTDGTPNVRTLDTSTILFVLVTEVADKVKTAAGSFTLANLLAANDGSYISMMDALEIGAYCITGAPPVTPPYGAKDYELINPTVNCDSHNCYVNVNIKNNTNTSSSIYMRLDVDGKPKFKRYVYLLRGRSKAQTALLNFAGINDGWHTITIAVGKVVDTDTYTHRFLVGASIEPPAAPTAPSLSAAEFVAEIRRRGTLDLARISMIPADNKWFRYAGQLIYRVAGSKGGMVITSPGKSNMYAAFSKDGRTVTSVETNWAMARIAELPFTTAPPAAPTAPSLSAAEFVAEIRRRGTLDLARISMIPADNKWFRYAGQLIYRVAGSKGGMVITSPGKSNMYAAFSKDGRTVTSVETNWAMARIAELPFTTAPPTAPTAKITKAELITEIRGRGAIETASISTVPGDNKWYMHYGRLNWHTANFEKGIEIRDLQTRNPPTQVSDISLTENKMTPLAGLDREWVLARLNELPYAVTPPVTPPYIPLVTPVTEPPEAIKRWIVANYGDGTRVTSGGWLKLYDANMANVLAPLPSGYTKASITEGVVQWAKANPNWETRTICGWISAIGVTNLTEDHGRYIHSLAIGWTTLANDFYNKLSPKPSRPSAAIVTDDNGRGVYGYAIGWNTLANEFTRCNF